jgi:hypothetical protein
MPFLLKSDYSAQIKLDLLNTVIDSQDYLRTDAEVAAQTEMEGYLRGKYDLSACFIDLQPWHHLQQYSIGAAVLQGTTSVTVPGPNGVGTVQLQVPVLYVATGPSIGVQPVPPAAPGAPAVGPWEQRDPRHALLKMYLIDATLYHLHSRSNPRAVPDVRRDRYDQVIDWLKDCRTGKVSPGLPLLPAVGTDGQADKTSIRVRGGSQPKMRNSY